MLLFWGVDGIVRDDDGTPLRSGCVRMDKVLKAKSGHKKILADTRVAVPKHSVLRALAF